MKTNTVPCATTAGQRMRSVIPFFPSAQEWAEIGSIKNTAGRPVLTAGLHEVINCIMDMTDTDEEIEWLTDAAILTMREWRGVGALRDLMAICPLRRRQ